MSDLEMVQDGLISVETAAAFLEVSRASLNRLIASGEIVSLKIGGARRVPRRALVEWTARRLESGRGDEGQPPPPKPSGDGAGEGGTS